MGVASFAAIILTALPYVIRQATDELRRIDEKQFNAEGKHPSKPTYDFIIVGGGTGGCVVAGRLSEHFKVLLLEAGGEPPLLGQVPAFYEYIGSSPDINYFYTTVPQKNVNNRKLDDVMGKMLGGSGSHNAIIYNRGHPKDYDLWAEVSKDSSWTYASLLKYFRKAESYHGMWPKSDQHGTDGPMTIVTSSRPMYPVWEEAAAELGYDVFDPNGPQREGFTPSDIMHECGRRVSTYTAYVQPHLKRKKLTVVRYAFVHKILLDGNQAIGVEYVRHGVKLQAYAQKEVIISAGTYSSPLVLQKSGIGPKDVLDKAKIELRKDLPVGKNLQNHQGISFGPFKINDPSKISSVNNNLTEEIFEDYLNHRPEIVLSENGVGTQGFLVSPQAKSRGESDWPDVQYFFIGTTFDTKGIYELPPDQFIIAVLVGRTKSEVSLGTVTLNATALNQHSIDNAELAVIDYKFLENKEDYGVLKYGMKTALKFFKTKAFKELETEHVKDPECAKANKFPSDGYLKCFIKKKGILWYHASGTCRMGFGAEDSNSVVDSKLRVHGFKGLRVVDASIMPKVTNANTNTAVIVIAEKAAEDIVNEHKNQKDGI